MSCPRSRAHSLLARGLGPRMVWVARCTLSHHRHSRADDGAAECPNSAQEQHLWLTKHGLNPAPARCRC